MTTKTRIITNPSDIDCPDSVINEWLSEWNNGNSEPVTLEDLDDITYDFICRAVDYGANQELRKGIEVLLKMKAEAGEIAGDLLKARRPLEFSPEQQTLNEIKVFKAFVTAELTRLENKLKSLTNVSE